MGLAIVKAILDAHGGGIDVLSRPAQGARFTFWLPIGADRSND
jgi:two-component system sensor histidine kinase KdpD